MIALVPQTARVIIKAHLFSLLISASSAQKALESLVRYDPEPPRQWQMRMIHEAWMATTLFIVEMTYFLIRGAKGGLSLPVIKELTIQRGTQKESFLFKPPTDYILDLGEMRQVGRMESWMGVEYGAGVLPYTLIPHILLSTIPGSSLVLCKGEVKRTLLSSMLHNERQVLDTDAVGGFGLNPLNDMVDRPSKIPGHQQHLHCSEENAQLLYEHLERLWPRAVHVRE